MLLFVTRGQQETGSENQTEIGGFFNFCLQASSSSLCPTWLMSEQSRVVFLGEVYVWPPVLPRVTRWSLRLEVEALSSMLGFSKDASDSC